MLETMVLGWVNMAPLKAWGPLRWGECPDACLATGASMTRPVKTPRTADKEEVFKEGRKIKEIQESIWTCITAIRSHSLRESGINEPPTRQEAINIDLNPLHISAYTSRPEKEGKEEKDN